MDLSPPRPEPPAATTWSGRPEKSANSVKLSSDGSEPTMSSDHPGIRLFGRLPIHLSTYPAIYPFTHPVIHPFTHLSGHPLFRYPAIHTPSYTIYAGCLSVTIASTDYL
ncbi:hypothetical protein EVAR_67595_1 [Eumeta japonica]|uniref:Uncharacterized protein n=1 Tax=Eumeta variegata TaxID=151549 RepID=A0A4C2A9H3_EUMVA|nr:hypothetical protein EVAR_67595_1 [Eumeta japonica]